MDTFAVKVFTEQEQTQLYKDLEQSKKQAEIERLKQQLSDRQKRLEQTKDKLLQENKATVSNIMENLLNIIQLEQRQGFHELTTTVKELKLELHHNHYRSTRRENHWSGLNICQKIHLWVHGYQYNEDEDDD